MPDLNPHIAQLKPSATLAINERVKELRAQGREIFHFGFGQSPFSLPDIIVDELKANAHRNEYLPSLGLPPLRSAISSYLSRVNGITTRPEQILIGPGSKELLFQTLMLVSGITLIPMGSWVSYLPQVIAKGGTFAIVPTLRENSYKLTPGALEDVCLANRAVQKTLILNSPNNPTGAVYTAGEYESLARVCREFDVLVLSDEIYSLLAFDEPASPSMAVYYPEQTIIFGGLSKIFSGGGYRLGFMALPAGLSELLPKYQALFSETFSAVASPVQYAAVKAYEYPESLAAEVARNKTILKAVATYVARELGKGVIHSTPPQGGFYTVIDLSGYQQGLDKLKVRNSTDLARHILDQTGVALLPGSDFYFPQKAPVFRLAFVDFDGKKWSTIPPELVTSSPQHIKEYAPMVSRGVHKLVDFVKQL